MSDRKPIYHGYRFPPEIIGHAVWLYYRFSLSFREVEDLLAEFGVEVFVSIRGRRHYLWRAVDQDGEVLDILVQRRRDGQAAKRFFRKLLKGQGGEPRRLVTDKLRSYGAAHRTVMPSVVHDTTQYANNRAELSHQPTRQRKRHMRRFKSWAGAPRFLAVHGVVQNLFRVGRHLLRAVNHRLLRSRAFVAWNVATSG